MCSVVSPNLAVKYTPMLYCALRTLYAENKNTLTHRAIHKTKNMRDRVHYMHVHMHIPSTCIHSTRSHIERHRGIPARIATDGYINMLLNIYTNGKQHVRTNEWTDEGSNRIAVSGFQHLSQLSLCACQYLHSKQTAHCYI